MHEWVRKFYLPVYSNVSQHLTVFGFDFRLRGTQAETATNIHSYNIIIVLEIISSSGNILQLFNGSVVYLSSRFVIRRLSASEQLFSSAFCSLFALFACAV